MSALLPRYAVRSALRDRGFAVTASLTLALGIGLSTAVFTVAQALLVRDLPVREQDDVAVLWGETPDRSFANFPLTYDQARDFRERARSLESAAFFAYYGAWPAPIRDGDEISRLRQAQVSGEFFDVLGVRPVLGRALRLDDDRVGARPVAVLSHAAWQRVYGGDASALGRRIVVHGSGVAHEIVGVMPPGLELPHGTEFWVPLVPTTTRPGTDSVNAYVHVVGRLANGATLAAARDELTSWFGRPESPPSLRELRGVATSAAAPRARRRPSRAHRLHGRLRAAPVDHLLQRGEPDPGSRRGASAGARGPRRARRRSQAGDRTAARRERRAGGDRRRARVPRRRHGRRGVRERSRRPASRASTRSA